MKFNAVFQSSENARMFTEQSLVDNRFIINYDCTNLRVEFIPEDEIPYELLESILENVHLHFGLHEDEYDLYL